MRSGTQIVGIALLAGGIIVAILLVAWLASGLADDSLEMSGAVLGGTIGFLFLVLPLAGVGAFLLVRGRSESEQLQRGARQRKMLGIIEAAGEISIADLALETGGTRDSVRDDLYDLVSKGLFSGYVNWDSGRLYARQASELRSMTHCANCGGELSLAGKGLIRCPYCGAEYFLP